MSFSARGVPLEPHGVPLDPRGCPDLLFGCLLVGFGAPFGVPWRTLLVTFRCLFRGVFLERLRSGVLSDSVRLRARRVVGGATQLSRRPWQTSLGSHAKNAENVVNHVPAGPKRWPLAETQ